jgi:hypothetical protein
MTQVERKRQTGVWIMKCEVSSATWNRPLLWHISATDITSWYFFFFFTWRFRLKLVPTSLILRSIRQSMFLMRGGYLLTRTIPSLEDQGLHFVGPLPFDLPGFVVATRSLSSGRNSSPDFRVRRPPRHDKAVSLKRSLLLPASHRVDFVPSEGVCQIAAPLPSSCPFL